MNKDFNNGQFFYNLFKHSTNMYWVLKSFTDYTRSSCNFTNEDRSKSKRGDNEPEAQNPSQLVQHRDSKRFDKYNMSMFTGLLEGKS